MIGIYRQLVNTACLLGVVKQAHLYESGFVAIEGKTYEGKDFSLTLSIKEEEKKDGN